MMVILDSVLNALCPTFVSQSCVPPKNACFRQQKSPYFQGLNLNMGRKMRLELTTSGTTNQRSNQLSYIRHWMIKIFTFFSSKSQEFFYKLLTDP